MSLTNTKLAQLIAHKLLAGRSVRDDVVIVTIAPTALADESTSAAVN